MVSQKNISAQPQSCCILLNILFTKCSAKYNTIAALLPSYYRFVCNMQVLCFLPRKEQSKLTSYLVKFSVFITYILRNKVYGHEIYSHSYILEMKYKSILKNREFI